MKRLSRLLLPALGVLAFAGGVAYATIPDGQGMIHACYDSRAGQVRIFDPGGGLIKGCSKTESETSWNQTGPQGPAGSQGQQGAKGDPGTQGPKGDPGNLGLAGQSCPNGTFVTGFDAAGAIVCGATTPPAPPPPPPPPPPLDCDDGNPYTIDAYNAATNSCTHTPLAPGTPCTTETGDPGYIDENGNCVAAPPP